MKKLLLIGLLAVSLGGCATFQKIESAISLTTRSFTNPITLTDLYAAENGVTLAFVTLNTYKAACINGTADKSCRANIQAIQAWTRQLPPLLAQLRTFVKTNDQLNAITVYNQLTALVATVKTAAANAGINVGS